MKTNWGTTLKIFPFWKVKSSREHIISMGRLVRGAHCGLGKKNIQRKLCMYVRMSMRVCVCVCVCLGWGGLFGGSFMGESILWRTSLKNLEIFCH